MILIQPAVGDLIALVADTYRHGENDPELPWNVQRRPVKKQD
jgi:hypothetical protein